MSHWIRAEYYLPDRVAVLTINFLELNGAGAALLKRAQDRPEDLEWSVIDLIDRMRPDLAGGVLLGIKAEYNPRQWEFLYSHRSLPVRKEGMWAEKMPLIPEPRKAPLTQDEAAWHSGTFPIDPQPDVVQGPEPLPS